MFQSLRQGATVYILYKNDQPKVDLGEVVSVGIPTPQFNATYQQNGQYLPQRNVVDIKVNVNGQAIDLQKLPADSNIADFGNNGMVVSMSKDAIITEIATLRNNSQRVLDSIDRHKSTIENCNKLMEELSPEIRKEAERDKEMDGLKQEIQDLRTMLKDFITQSKN